MALTIFAYIDAGTQRQRIIVQPVSLPETAR
jgi:hypothetical protein